MTRLPKNRDQLISDVLSGRYSAQRIRERNGFTSVASYVRRLQKLVKDGMLPKSCLKKPNEAKLRFQKDWNGYTLSNTELIVLYNLKSIDTLLSKVSTMRRQGYEMRRNRDRVQVWQDGRRIVIGSRKKQYKQSDVVDEKPYEEVTEEERKSIITSYKKGCNIRINSQVHAVQESAIRQIIKEYNSSVKLYEKNLSQFTRKCIEMKG
jgi:hypothetical protein